MKRLLLSLAAISLAGFAQAEPLEWVRDLMSMDDVL